MLTNMDREFAEEGITTFNMFLAKNDIGDDAELVPLLKNVWNQAIDAACEYCNTMEGSDFGVHELRVTK